MNAVRRGALIAALASALLAAPTAAWSEDGMGSEAGVGAAAALSTLIYGPVKLVYATLGLIIGGTAWGLSGGDHDVLDAVITPSVRGDYVVTPEHIRMERGLEFYGQNPTYRSSTVQHAAVVEEGFIEEDY